MVATIMTREDLIAFGRVGADFPTCEIADIYNIEFSVFRGCGLGVKFYNILLNDLTDFTVVTAYAPGSEYAENDMVSYKGRYYKAKDAVPEDTFPSDISFWKLATKFKTPCYEDFFCRFLGPFLALQIVRNQIPFAVAKFGAEGLITFNGNNYKTAKEEERQTLYVAIDKMLGTVFSNMEYFIKNDDGSCFTDTAFVSSTCGTCQKTDCNGKCTEKYDKRNYYRAGYRTGTDDGNFLAGGTLYGYDKKGR
jgi:hypothetical protein